VSVRPVLRMALRPEQLLELILGVTGKNAERIEQILRGGSVAAGGFRYWWEALEASLRELEPLLAAFPDADPSRPFDPARCVVVAAEGAAATNALAEFTQQAASRRRTLRRRSLWDVLLDAVREQLPGYRSYCYQRRGDLYALELAENQGAGLAREAQQLGVGEVRAQSAALTRAARLVYVCSR